MGDALEQLRLAARSLYASQSSAERAAADAWMRGFVGQEGAWRALASLLAAGGASPDEQFLAASSLRRLCLRQRGVVEPGAAPQLARLLAEQLAAAVVVGCSHTSNQLAAALAALAVRAPNWPPEALVAQLLDLAAGALAAANAPAEQQQLALLRLLAALAEAALAREASMHPQRREALVAALLTAPQALAAVQQALAGAPGSGAASVSAALQLLQAWCGLGAPPAGAEAQPELWQQLHSAVLHPDLCAAAAEAASALYACCCPPLAEGSNAHGGGGRAARRPSNSAGSSGGSPELAQRRRRVLGLLLSQLPAFAAALQEALQQAQGPQAQAQLLCAGLAVLGAAAQAADSQAGGSSGGAEAAAQAVHFAAELALAALQHPHPQVDVTLAALQHWDQQIERWQAAAAAEQQQQGAANTPAPGACTPQQRQALLGRLCGALLQRLALPAGVAPACVTADARDLPDSVQLVRREVSDTFRGAVDALGPAQARQQLLQLAGEALAAWRAAGGGGTHWQQLECCLFALNLVWARQRSVQQEEAAAEVRQAAGAAAAALDPAAPKLAGTALTLLGGMAEQLPLLEAEQPRAAQQAAQQEAPLGQVLTLLLQLVRQRSDDKLSRNAATCCHRLTAHRPLAALLAARHPGWADALCGCFADAGGMQERARGGADLSTAQFLLASVSQLAAAAADAGGAAAAAAPHDQASSSGGGGRQLLAHLLSQPAAAAEAALAAAAAAPVGSAQRRHHLQAAALQIETVAVALESVAGSGSSSMREQLPHLVSGLAPMLQHAAAAAAQPSEQGGQGEQQQQQQEQQHAVLQALCRLVAAVAGTPAAAMGVQLVTLFAAAPQHPCVLQALALLASGSSGSGSGGSGGPSEVLEQQLAAALHQAIQAAAAARSADADWQAPVLQLGRACVQGRPAVAAEAATLGALLCTAEHSLRSWHRDVCEAALQFSESLLCVGCQQRRAGSAAAGATPAAPSDAAAAEQHLQARLDVGGLGSSLVLRLLLAASGAMPPYMLAPVADALHRCWRSVGDARFGAWLRGAALGGGAPDEAPWRRWKPEAAAAAVDDLLSAQNAGDPRRFKRLLKVFCGGKKKGTSVEQPARGG